ncbi:MAG: autotransporter outer membrane beta-barrel domain-containing protein [Roseiarcus sp.]
MPELANQLGFAMIDNYDARMGGEREEVVLPGAMTGVNCEALPTHKGELPTHKGCMTPHERATADTQMREEAVQRYLIWGSVLGATGEQQPGGSATLPFGTPFLNGKGPRYSASYVGIQAGIDLWRGTSVFGGRDDAGLYVGYLDAHASVDQVYSSANAGSVSMNAYSLGAYATHFAPEGWYLDSVLQGTWLGDVKGYTPLTGMSVSGSTFAASLEGGYPYHFATSWTLEPQAQLIYQYVDIGSGDDLYGYTSFGNTDDFRGRIGAKLSYVALSGFNAAPLPVTLWDRVNLWHDFLYNAPSATFATLNGLNPVTLDGTLGGTWGELDIGVDAPINNFLNLYGLAFYDHSVDGGQSWSAGGRIGLKVEF